LAEKEKRPKDFPLIRSKDSTVENQVSLALRKKLKREPEGGEKAGRPLAG